MLAVSAQISVYGPETTFAVPERNGSVGRRRVGRSARPQAGVGARARRAAAGRAWKTLPCRTTAAGEDVSSRFAFVRVVATHPVRTDNLPPREEWLIIEWPARRGGAERLLALQPARRHASRERLARLARLRWTIELDYRQLKGELGLDHYEGRSYAGFHHHCALVTCAHAFLTAGAARPKSPAAGLTLPQAVLLLQPVLRCWAGRCRTCHQPVDLDQLALFHRRE